MESTKKYWKGLEELNKTPEFVEKNKGEFAELLPIEEVLEGSGLKSVTPRRDFLKAMGFGLGAVTLAACHEAPVKKAIPYLIKPEEVTPGIPNYYVSSYKGSGIIVKTREGRPIKLEGNPECPINGGGLDAQGQASVLDLYDNAKLHGPLLKGSESSWSDVDAFVKGELNKVQAGGKAIAIVTASLNSPSAKKVVAEFTAQYPNTKLVNYDPVSYAGIIKANADSFGKAVVPQYNFDKASVIVSFGADFLGSWISPSQYSRQYSSNRNYKSLEGKKMSRHIQFEAGLSQTGSAADSRIAIKPSQEGAALLSLYAALTGSSVSGASLANNQVADIAIKLAAKELSGAKGASLVVSGSNDPAIQTIVNAINSFLGSYGTTIDLDNANYQHLDNGTDFTTLVSDMKSGAVGAVFFLNANPGYNFVDAKGFEEALSKVALKVSFADRKDETATLCDVVASNHNFLESWGDANPIEGVYSIIQPTINPIYNTRQAEESLLIWSNNVNQDYYSFVKNNWESSILPSFGKAWKDVLQVGVLVRTAAAKSYTFNGDVNASANAIASKYKSVEGAIELALYTSPVLGDGSQANNPVLQETPDPISKVTWDNYVAINPKYAEKLGLNQFDLVKVEANGYTIELPVLHQPGQAHETVSIALGYGRKLAGKVGDDLGKNAYPLVGAASVTLEKIPGFYELAQTQTHHSFEGRNVIRETTFTDYKKDPTHGSGNHGPKHKTYDLWDAYDKPGHNWVMAIDLNACTGCGACITACNIENNVPVVGKDEVRRRREMHWLRIDRYYTFNEEGKQITEEKEIEAIEGRMENISVVHQPMLCQHCEHAPCETVCPVLATVHSSDGLNHMAYNRCVGTRYCANNCPYKVRRFNWFNYWNDSRFDNYLNNEFTQLVLNPDVTTRSRGVMEKCSMCIQRIQAGKLQAKIEKRELKDGDIKMACQQTCASNAIIFGDANDPNSEVSKALKNERVYYVLEELNVQPGVGYMTKVTNTGLQEA
jgi:MoCo/4Fe-4S cofactor protein with predicted Tat translocation signal